MGWIADNFGNVWGDPPSLYLGGIEPCPTRPSSDKALTAARAAMDAAADREVVHIIRQRAHRIESDPGLLFTIPSLSPLLPWDALLANVATMIESEERGELRRWDGFGGESPAYTLRAVKLYAERMRDRERAEQVAAE